MRFAENGGHRQPLYVQCKHSTWPIQLVIWCWNMKWFLFTFFSFACLDLESRFIIAFSSMSNRSWTSFWTKSHWHSNIECNTVHVLHMNRLELYFVSFCICVSATFTVCTAITRRIVCVCVRKRYHRRLHVLFPRWLLWALFSCHKNKETLVNRWENQRSQSLQFGMFFGFRIAANALISMAYISHTECRFAIQIEINKNTLCLYQSDFAMNAIRSK